jgi:hypothetical protein
MAAAAVAEQSRDTREEALPPRPVTYFGTGAKAQATIQDGHYLLGEDDAVLAQPVVYNNPLEPDVSVRFIHGQYPLPKFTAGTITVWTKRQEEIVRRMLKGNADRWRGEDMAEERCCKHRQMHNFCTRNRAAWDDHVDRFSSDT